jgi:hypothetical protein
MHMHMHMCMYMCMRMYMCMHMLTCEKYTVPCLCVCCVCSLDVVNSCACVFQNSTLDTWTEDAPAQL